MTHVHIVELPPTTVWEQMANDESFIRGAAMVLGAPASTPAPASIHDVLRTNADDSQYEPRAGWHVIGYTKTGVAFVKEAEVESFDVDQVHGTIMSRPVSERMVITTSLVEVNGNVVMTTPPDMTQLAVVVQRHDAKTLRAFTFRHVQRIPTETSFAHLTDGLSVVVRWQAVRDGAGNFGAMHEGRT